MLLTLLGVSTLLPSDPRIHQLYSDPRHIEILHREKAKRNFLASALLRFKLMLHKKFDECACFMGTAYEACKGWNRPGPLPRGQWHPEQGPGCPDLESKGVVLGDFIGGQYGFHRL